MVGVVRHRQITGQLSPLCGRYAGMHTDQIEPLYSRFGALES
jgi:hypothetical protein